MDKTGIRFPLVLCFSKDVIIETFEEGMYVNRLVTGDHEVFPLNLSFSCINFLLLSLD